MNDLGTQSDGCDRHAFTGSRKQPACPKCSEQVPKHSRNTTRVGLSFGALNLAAFGADFHKLNLIRHLFCHRQKPLSVRSNCINWRGESGKEYQYDFPVGTSFQSQPGNFIYAMPEPRWEPCGSILRNHVGCVVAIRPKRLNPHSLKTNL